MSRFRYMLESHNSILSGQLGDIVTTKHLIELKPVGIPKNKITNLLVLVILEATFKQILQQLFLG